jgi:hypothetical protein
MRKTLPRLALALGIGWLVTVADGQGAGAANRVNARGVAYTRAASVSPDVAPPASSQPQEPCACAPARVEECRTGTASPRIDYAGYGWTWGPGTAFRDGPPRRF